MTSSGASEQDIQETFLCKRFMPLLFVYMHVYDMLITRTTIGTKDVRELQSRAVLAKRLAYWVMKSMEERRQGNGYDEIQYLIKVEDDRMEISPTTSNLIEIPGFGVINQDTELF